MKVVLATSESSPFAKTGGLADMISMLAGSLGCCGVEISVIMPLYRHISPQDYNFEKLEKIICVDMGKNDVSASIWRGSLPGCCGSGCEVYFIENNEYFDRPFLYGDENGDYADNCERFVFFSRAVLESIKAIEIAPDLIHCHDWQTSLVPVYISTLYANDPCFENIRTLLTIHNLAYQGVFWHWDWPLTSLDWSLFCWQGLEFYGKINFLKGGIVFADAISTVSKTYSREIQYPEYGCGLDGVLKSRRADLYGIVNGMDSNLWNPANDKCIKANYDIKDMSGKRKCKGALQYEFKLEGDAGLPLIAMVGDLTEHKGIGILEDCLEELMQEPIQLIVLGVGDSHTVERFEKIEDVYPSKISFCKGFDDRLYHRIIAGSDMLLMPSLFEPCGYNQLIAMRYGTVPIVHSVGGLSDTVIDFSLENIINEDATGFVFLEDNPAALLMKLNVR